VGQQQLMSPLGQITTWTPLVDMRETDNAYLIHAELPGIKREDISVDLNGDMLTLSGERTEKKKEENARMYR
jgi:HSP20 family protein